MAAAGTNQTLFFQLYKNANDQVAEKRVRNVERLGYKAIFLTADAVVHSNRELDIRVPWTLEDIEGTPKKFYVEGRQDAAASLTGTAGALVANDDRDMTWDKVGFFCSRVLVLPGDSRLFPGYAKLPSCQ